MTIDTSTPVTTTSNTIAVRVSGDAYSGLPQFRLWVDGVQVGATQSVSANHSLGQWQTINFDLASAPISQVKVEFINDAWGGSADKDRNLYVNSIDINGVKLLPQQALYDRYTMPDIPGQTNVGWNGALVFNVAGLVGTGTPAVPTIASFSTDSGLAGDHLTNDNTLTLTGTAAVGSTVKVYDGANLLGSATADGNGAWSYTTAALADGGHNFTATATDTAGVTGAASSALAVAVDTTAPIVPIITSNTTDSTKTIALAGTAEANSTVKIYEGALLLGSIVASGTGAWAYTTAPLADGVHTLTATATDAAGNTSLASQAVDPIVGPTTVESNGSTSLIEIGGQLLSVW